MNPMQVILRTAVIAHTTCKWVSCDHAEKRWIDALVVCRLKWLLDDSWKHEIAPTTPYDDLIDTPWNDADRPRATHMCVTMYFCRQTAAPTDSRTTTITNTTTCS